jgi:hypothetical protein
MAPMEEITAPTRNVFLRPRRSPNRAASKQPPRFPSCADHKLEHAIKSDGALTEKQLAVMP